MIDIIISQVSYDGQIEATLLARCSEEGFRLILQCSDGISEATSQLFTWEQIAQILIAADPNIFGTLDEPLHQVFPQNLKCLGYSIPNWQ